MPGLPSDPCGLLTAAGVPVTRWLRASEREASRAGRRLDRDDADARPTAV